MKKTLAVAAAGLALTAGLVAVPTEAHAVAGHEVWKCRIVAKRWPATMHGDLVISTREERVCRMTWPKWFGRMGYSRNAIHVHKVLVLGW